MITTLPQTRANAWARVQQLEEGGTSTTTGGLLAHGSHGLGSGTGLPAQGSQPGMPGGLLRFEVAGYGMDSITVADGENNKEPQQQQTVVVQQQQSRSPIPSLRLALYIGFSDRLSRSN